MDFRIIELGDTVVYGVSKQYEGQGYKDREELRNSMWSDDYDDVPVSSARVTGIKPEARLMMAFGTESGGMVNI